MKNSPAGPECHSVPGYLKYLNQAAGEATPGNLAAITRRIAGAREITIKALTDVCWDMNT